MLYCRLNVHVTNTVERYKVVDVQKHSYSNVHNTRIKETAQRSKVVRYI